MIFDTVQFGEKVKNLRKLHAYSQKQVAECLGVSPTQISDIEKGKSSPSFKRAIMLASLFNTSLDYLAGISDKIIVDKQHKSEFNLLFETLTHDQQMKVLGYIDCLKDK